MKPTPFYLVWCPTRGEPTVQQPDFETASREAERLATMNPGESFYVMGAVERVINTSVQRERFAVDEDEYIPF